MNPSARTFSTRSSEAVSQYFFQEVRNVRLDAGRRTVRFNQILEFYSGDFLKKAPSLLAYANGYREENLGRVEG